MIRRVLIGSKMDLGTTQLYVKKRGSSFGDYFVTEHQYRHDMICVIDAYVKIHDNCSD